MYKVMLVDSDPGAIDHIKECIAWEKHNAEVVAIASNGVDALELAHRYTPHMMFLAVNIPQMDGLSLLAALRKEFPKLQITIFSEHSDFTYAQRGIELGIVRYVLKPGTTEELNEAMSFMAEHYEMLSSVVFPEAKEEHVTENFIVQNALHYMEEHYNEHLTLPSVAEHIFVSQWHLSKLISKNKGESFNELLNGIRVERAKDLLEHTSLQIQEISSRVGFNDATHFARVFKRQTGESANQYRNRVLSEKNNGIK